MKKSSTPHPAPSRKTHNKKSHPLSFSLPLMKSRKGFTLIELMIAMAIIAILATAGIQAYSGYVKKGRDTARAEIASNLNTAVMSYAASNGGNPPAGPDAFASFLASTSEVFGGGSIGSDGSLTIEDPVGGANVCLDAAGTANQPCSVHYTAYTDGTYAISYGVEHESSKEANFYKTEVSIVKPGSSQETIEKYGVYIGSAPYIGSDPTTPTNLAPVDTTASLNVAYMSQRIDVVSVANGGSGSISGGGAACGVTNCNVGQQCSPGNICTDSCGDPENFCPVGDTCTAGICVPPDPCDASQNPIPGRTCADLTMYVTPDIRTTTDIIPGKTWYQAMTYCTDYRFGNYSDWYLPAIDELIILYNNKGSIGGFDQYVNTNGSGNWSSTDYTGYPGSATVHPTNPSSYGGGVFGFTKGSSKNYLFLRCIRTP